MVQVFPPRCHEHSHEHINAFSPYLCPSACVTICVCLCPCACVCMCRCVSMCVYVCMWRERAGVLTRAGVCPRVCMAEKVPQKRVALFPSEGMCGKLIIPAWPWADNCTNRNNSFDLSGCNALNQGVQTISATALSMGTPSALAQQHLHSTNA